MTLSVAKTKSTKWSITAINVDGFEAFRSVIGRIGYGIKKKHPNIPAINSNDGSNRLTIQEQDLIHNVDLDEDNILYRATMLDHDIVSSSNSRPNSNFIRLT